jgi:hypothetical protein
MQLFGIGEAPLNRLAPFSAESFSLLTQAVRSYLFSTVADVTGNHLLSRRRALALVTEWALLANLRVRLVLAKAIAIGRAVDQSLLARADAHVRGSVILELPLGTEALDRSESPVANHCKNPLAHEAVTDGRGQVSGVQGNLLYAELKDPPLPFKPGQVGKRSFPSRTM